MVSSVPSVFPDHVLQNNTVIQNLQIPPCTNKQAKKHFLSIFQESDEYDIFGTEKPECLKLYNKQLS